MLWLLILLQLNKLNKDNPILRNYSVNKVTLFCSYLKGKTNINTDVYLYIDTNGKLRGLDFVRLNKTHNIS